MLQKMWQYSAGNRKNVVLFFVLFFFANTVWLLDPVLVALILNTVQEKGITEATLPTLALLFGSFILIQIVGWIFHGPARVIEIRNAFLVRANYKKFLIDGTMALPVSWHTDHHSGDTIDKIEKGTNSLFEFSRNTFEITKVIVEFIISYIVLSYFNIHATYIVLFMVFFTFTLILRFDKILIRQLEQLYTSENRISAKVYDVIGNIITVIILRIENLVSNAIVKKIMSPFSLFVRHTKVNEVKWFLVSLCGAATLFLVMFSYIFISVRAGSVVLIGTVYLLYQYVSNVVNIFYNFAWMYGQIVERKTAIMNAESLAEEFVEDAKVPEMRLPEEWKKLDINNLTFSYQGKDGSNMHLDRISFSISMGEKIAFIGESGSGKTTMLKVIRGLYAPRRVTCILDGKTLPHGFLSISPDISLIPQDPEIFSTTIKENITVGVPHTLEYLRRFTDMAECTDVIERLPKKWHSSVVEKGVNLSGGEKQRLALARGLLASVDKEIILFDEPTSSVDSRNERIIYEHIFSEFHDKVIISSIHRLHLLPMFDAIYLFDHGRILAHGDFETLLKTSSEFQKLWERYHRGNTKRVRPSKIHTPSA